MVALSSLRPGSGADAVDGVVPRQVAAPDSGEGLASTLAHASRERWRTVICGGATKLDWGRPPEAIDLLISTARLNQLVVHRHGDLTVTAQPGLRLSDLNRTLRTRHQWLPLESPFEGATLGGLVATNESGPSRLRNGTPRDLVIGVTLGLTDGRLVKSGGTVVKNVAGYDLSKFVSGSHGALAAIVDVTFKLVPVPHASATLVARYMDAAALARDAAAVASSQLEPAAFDVRADVGTEATASPRQAPLSLFVRFASSPAATDAQVSGCRALLSGDVTQATGEEERLLWTRQIETPWQDGAAVVRFSWLPARLPQVLVLLEEIQRSLGGPLTLTGRIGGSGVARVGGTPTAQAAAVTRLRESSDVGNVVVLRGSGELKRLVDVWGPPRSADVVVRSLKQMFDPAGILNAGRGPL